MKNKTTNKLILLEPGLWLDTQRGEVVFDSDWLDRTVTTGAQGGPVTEAEMEKIKQHLRTKAMS